MSKSDVSVIRSNLYQKAYDLGFSISLSLLFAFGIWTIFCNLAVLLQLNFHEFIRASYLGLSLVVFGGSFIFWLSRQSKFHRTSLIVPEARNHKEPRWILHLSVGLLFTVISRLSGSYEIFWILSVSYLIFVAVRYYLVGEFTANNNSVKSATMLSVFLVVAILLYGLLQADSSLDDSYYVNLIVGMLNYPDLPILWKDTLFGPGELLHHNSVYMVNGYEPLQAVLIYHFGIDPFILRQFVFVPIAAIVSIILWAKCCQLVSPRNWEYLLTLFLLLVFVWSTQFRMVGQFYFEYLYMGKSVLVACVFPALIYATIQWYQSGRLVHWLVLFVLNAAAVGFSPNGLYVAPIAVGLLLCGLIQFNASGLLRFGYGIAACLYPVVAALLLILNVEVSPSENLEPETIYGSLRTSLGWGWYYWAMLPLIVAGWSTQQYRSTRRLLIFWTLAFLLTIANPMLDHYWAHYVTGNLNWRLVWSFPILLVVALALQGLWCKIPIIRKRVWMLPMLILCISLILKNFSTISYNKWEHFDLFEKRVPSIEFKIASDLNEILMPSDRLLAPRNISAYIVTMNEYPFPIVTRPLYLLHMRKKLSETELLRRALLYTLVAPEEIGTGALMKLHTYLRQHMGIAEKDLIPQSIKLFANEIRIMSISCVVLSPENKLKPELSEILLAANYRMKESHGFQIWLAPTLTKIHAAPLTVEQVDPVQPMLLQ